MHIILNLLNEESVSGVVELVYQFDKKSYHKCLHEKVSRSLYIHSTIQFFLSTNMYILYEDTNTNHFTPLTLRVQGNKQKISIRTDFGKLEGNSLAFFCYMLKENKNQKIFVLPT